MPPKNQTPIARHAGEGVFIPDSPLFMCGELWDAQTRFESFLRPRYSIASYRDVVWPLKNTTVTDLMHKWNGRMHPDKVAQNLIAHVVLYALIQEFDLQNVRSETCTIPALDGKRCKRLWSDFRPGVDNPPPIHSHEWNLDLVRKRAPGWTSTGKGDSEITFEVKMSNTLAVSFLQSFETLSNATMQTNGCAEEILLNPLWDQKSSVVRQLKFSSIQSPGHVVWRCLKAVGRRAFNLTFRTQGVFKLARIVTC